MTGVLIWHLLSGPRVMMWKVVSGADVFGDMVISHWPKGWQQDYLCRKMIKCEGSLARFYDVGVSNWLKGR